MIKSFADKETEKVYNQFFSKKLPQTIQRIALRKLMMIDNARCLEDLRVPPANHLEMLHGDREGQYSIRINIQYRICFNLAQAINVPASRVQDILHGRRKITADTSLRLAKFFGVSDRYFLDLQNDIDIRNLKIQLANEISKIPVCQVG